MKCPRSVIVALFIACITSVSASVSVPTMAAEREPVASLAASLEDFIRLLEKDDLKSAGRWARDAEAGKLLEERWAQLRQCHKDYDYRKWLDGDPAGAGPGARQVGDATKFTVGGHSYGHHYVDWEKGANGWRIADLRICR